MQDGWTGYPPVEEVEFGVLLVLVLVPLRRPLLLRHPGQREELVRHEELDDDDHGPHVEVAQVDDADEAPNHPDGRQHPRAHALVLVPVVDQQQRALNPAAGRRRLGSGVGGHPAGRQAARLDPNCSLAGNLEPPPPHPPHPSSRLLLLLPLLLGTAIELRGRLQIPHLGCCRWLARDWPSLAAPGNQLRRVRGCCGATRHRLISSPPLLCWPRSQPVDAAAGFITLTLRYVRLAY